jgi:hypothetical protein
MNVERQKRGGLPGLYWVLISLLLCVVGEGCKKKASVPEHEVQKQATQRKRAELLSAKAAATKGRPDAGVATGLPDERRWTPAVQRAFRIAFKSRADVRSAPLRRLAQEGAAAVPALRYLIANKKQPKANRAMYSFLLADIHMFRPRELSKFAANGEFPILQRAAIDGLVRLRNPQAQALVETVRKKAPPMNEFIDRAQTNPAWTLSAAQVGVLDKVFQERDPRKIQTQLETLGGEYEPGLLGIVHSPASRAPLVGLSVRKLVELAATNSTKLKSYAATPGPQVLRFMAATALLKMGDKARSFVKRLAENPRDPAARGFKRILAGKPFLPFASPAPPKAK